MNSLTLNIRTSVSLAVVLLYAAATGAQTADERTTQESPDEPSFERHVIDQAIKDLKVFAGELTEPMHSHIVMRWPNNVRGTKDGATVLLTHDGRPQAACCVYTWQGHELHYGFGSLSTKPVSAEVDGEVAWRPKDAGVEFRVLPDAPEPATKAASRLLQMRQLSRRFGSKCIESKTKSYELRLLSKPIYRYDLDDSRRSAELIDGAVFAFAQGTDPESLLLIEARRAESGPQWQYATAKRTVGQIDMALDRKQVHVHKWGGWNPFQPEAIFSTLKRPIKRDE
ncbi:MAG: hypothetical protein H8E66_20250 [Planctomycetes bacterium]|nr:hypothetical protein [Planctomycetota bacterium]